MKKTIWLLTLLSLTGLLLTGAAYHFTNYPVFYTLAITCGTTFYHFVMRLAVGYAIDARFRNRMDCTKKWFRERPFEASLYRKLRVRNWKKYVPSFQPQSFRMKARPVTDIIQATCQAELVHEVIMVFSFVPLLFSIWFGAGEVFFITSCIACLFDSIFVILQRYNRPRLIRLTQKKTTE